MKTWHGILGGAIIGAVLGVLELTQQPQSSAPNQAALDLVVKTSLDLDVRPEGMLGALELGSAAIGPKKGDASQGDYQASPLHIDRIIEGMEIKVR